MITGGNQSELRIHHTVSQHFNRFAIHVIAVYRRISHFTPHFSTYFAYDTHHDNDYTTDYDIRNHIKVITRLWQYRNELRNSLGQHAGLSSQHGSRRGASILRRPTGPSTESGRSWLQLTGRNSCTDSAFAVISSHSYSCGMYSTSAHF